MNATDTNTRPIATRTVNVNWLKAVNAYNGVARYSAIDLDTYAGKVHTIIDSNIATLGAVTAHNVDMYYHAANDAIVFAAKKTAAKAAEPAKKTGRRNGLRWNSLRVNCPYCKAPTGHSCVNRSGANVRWFHGLRYTLANG